MRLGREVGPAVERLAVGRQEDAHRPAALAGHRLDRGHVDLVEVGPLLAVDLDRDEVPVQVGGRGRVLEALALHDVAPVAGGVADREEDRPVLGLRPGERLRSPRVPVDRVVGVLEEVRAGLAGESVGHGRMVGARTSLRFRRCATDSACPTSPTSPRPTRSTPPPPRAERLGWEPVWTTDHVLVDSSDAAADYRVELRRAPDPRLGRGALPDGPARDVRHRRAAAERRRAREGDRHARRAVVAAG